MDILEKIHEIRGDLSAIIVYLVCFITWLGHVCHLYEYTNIENTLKLKHVRKCSEP